MVRPHTFQHQSTIYQRLRARTHWLYSLGSALLRMSARLLFRLRVSGVENIPKEGRIIIACNHISVLDPPLVGISIPRNVHYAAKMGIFRGAWNPFFRWVNAVPVRRKGSDKEAIRALLHALEQDEAILIFPEGTNSPSGKPLPAKPGIGLLALKTNSRILPVRIEGTQHGERGKSHLFRFIFRRIGEGVHIHFGEPYNPMEKLSEEMTPRSAYRTISEEVMDHIMALEENNSRASC